MNRGKKLVSSNLAMLAFYRDKKGSLEEYQKKVRERLEESVNKAVGGEVDKVELHLKGFINIFFASLSHLG